MEQLYILNNISGSNRSLFAGGQWVNDSTQRCPSCGAFDVRSEPSEIQIALNHVGRQGFVEYLWNSHSLPIFRQDLIDLWQERGLTGFGLKPVRIVGWYDQPRRSLPANIPSYHRVVATSFVRLIEPAPVTSCHACGFVSYGFPKVGTHLSSGLRIDPESWNGTDLSGLMGYVFLFCTRRTAAVTLDAGFSKHISFVRTQDWGTWEQLDVRKWTPEAYRQYREGFLIRRSSDL